MFPKIISFWEITLCAFTISVLSLILCYPIINIFSTYIPQLFGKPRKSGPFLPDLESVKWKEALRKRLNK